MRLGNTAGRLGWLIDTRSWGGYVVAPPTAIAGHPYRMVVHAALAPLPGWIATALRPTPRPAERPATVELTAPQRVSGGTRRDAYLSAAIRAQLDAVTTATEGGRNRALYLSATALGQLVAGGELDPGHVTVWLTKAGQTAGLEPVEIARTVDSGLRAGAKRPRTLTTRLEAA